MMFAAVYGMLAVLVSVVRFMEVGLRVCMWFVLRSMAALGRAMGVGEARIIRNLCLLEYMGIGVIALLGAHYSAAMTCAMGHLLHDLFLLCKTSEMQQAQTGAQDQGAECALCLCEPSTQYQASLHARRPTIGFIIADTLKYNVALVSMQWDSIVTALCSFAI